MNFEQYLNGIAQNISAARQIISGDDLHLTERERAHRLLIVTKRLDVEMQKVENLLVLLKRGGSVDMQIRANDLLIKLKTLHSTLNRLRLELNIEWL